MPIALSDEDYDLDGDLDDPEACDRVLARWRQGGSQARYFGEQVDPKELVAVVRDDVHFRDRRQD